MDKETHSCCVLFIFESKVDEVRPLGDEFDASKFWTSLPVLVVYAELHPFRCIQKQQETHLVDVCVCELLSLFHFYTRYTI